MIKGIEAVLLSSQHARKLADFYKKVVGLKCTMDFVMGEHDEEGFVFELKKGSPSLYIVDHSKIKGKSKESSRVIFNLEVDNIKKEVVRMKKAKAKVIADVYHVQDYGYIATFADVDGNYFQFVQTRPGKKK